MNNTNVLTSPGKLAQTNKGISDFMVYLIITVALGTILFVVVYGFGKYLS